jgi:hypothetical protein
VNQVRHLAGLMVATLAATGCSLISNRDVDKCAALAVRQDSAFDAAGASALAGTYQLIMISEASNEFSHSVRGPLELLTANLPAAASTDGEAGSPVLWGSAQLPKRDVTIPWVYDPSSRDASRPGLLVHANGDIDLGGKRATGQPGVSMHIESVAEGGFGGTWTSVPDAPLPLNAKGDPLPTPHGRFCALRRGVTQPKSRP